MKSDHKIDTACISDEQLVDYLLNLLPQNEQQHLQQYIDHDIDLQNRLNSWQSALFRFHDETTAQKPHKRVWNNLEKQLFNDEKISLKSPWWRRLSRPALLSLCLTMGIGFYFLQINSYQPSASAQYHAAVDARLLPITLWEVEGNQNSIAFTSLRDVSEKGRECVAWLKQGNKDPIRLGAIPDTGDKTFHRIQLPQQLTAHSGDQLIIAMVKHGDTNLPPKNEQHIVTLSNI